MKRAGDGGHEAGARLSFWLFVFGVHIPCIVGHAS